MATLWERTRVPAEESVAFKNAVRPSFARAHAHSPTLSPTDPVPRGLLTLWPRDSPALYIASALLCFSFALLIDPFPLPLIGMMVDPSLQFPKVSVVLHPLGRIGHLLIDPIGVFKD